MCFSDEMEFHLAKTKVHISNEEAKILAGRYRTSTRLLPLLRQPTLPSATGKIIHFES